MLDRREQICLMDTKCKWAKVLPKFVAAQNTSGKWKIIFSGQSLGSPTEFQIS